MVNEQEKMIKLDRMRFTKNKLSANLSLLAIVANVLYFACIYRSNFNYYYSFTMGVSVIANLVFMLAAFLSSEGVKQYKLSYSVVLVCLGVIEIVRIFILPLKAHTTSFETVVEGQKVTQLVMEDAQFTRVVVYLSSAAFLLIVAGVVGIIRHQALTNYKKTLEIA